ncbi:hypothetical protein Adu01nite_29440 [Paractinoplanes durhamensis]|uniref:Uncharacterized protein n=1 Tax=Paractinoplanes durhamensis TaxID=113563 RepID=A0ABQ3YVJ1_9ACTN|nr:hypothetical protein Adu01nite_29440 [Actinoplanes durhamensis]
MEQVANRSRPVLEQFQHPDPHWMTERSEQLGLDLMEGNTHDIVPSSRCGYEEFIT